MLNLRRLLAVSLLVLHPLCAGNKEAAKLFKQGQKAEKSGDVVRAYLLYADAAALDPKNTSYWARSKALRTKAAMKAKVLPKADPSLVSRLLLDTDEATTPLSPEDLADVRRLKPPPELKVDGAKKTLDLRGDSKAVWEQIARAYGLDVVFDGEYQAGAPVRFSIQDADYRDAIHQLEMVTGSFVVVLSDKLFLVAKDTPQKRVQVEPTVAVMVPIPDAVTVQEAQETARAVQQTMEILKFAVDANRRMVFMKDRVSKVLLARALFEQLARSRAEVSIDLQMLEVDRSSFLSYGLMLPTEFPIVYLGNAFHSIPQFASTVTNFLLFGGGQTLFGLGVADAKLFANMNRSTSKNLLDAEIRSLDGSPATFHVGDKYPITTGVYSAFGAGGYSVPPQFQFEDLGLVLKITPHVHGVEEVSLDIESEFKVLTGSSVNGVPVISNRKLNSKVRLKEDQWALVAGLMSLQEAKNISGMAGLSTLPLLGPLFRQNEKTRDEKYVLILIKPRLLSPPPSAEPTRAFYAGTESRLQTPL